MADEHKDVNEEHLAAYLDGELPADLRPAVEARIESDPSWKEMYQAQKGIGQLLTHTLHEGVPNEPYEQYWESLAPKLTRKTGTGLFLVGLMLVAAVGLYMILTSFLNPLMKAGLSISALGLCIWFYSVYQEKKSVDRDDPYRKVQR